VTGKANKSNNREEKKLAWKRENVTKGKTACERGHIGKTRRLKTR